jgi:hypothetical protein
MYLASFTLGSEQIKQGCLHFPGVRPVTEERRHQWWKAFEGLLCCAGAVAGGEGALRVLLDDKRQLDRLLLVSAPASSESPMRRYIASFARLNNIIDGSLNLPLQRIAHDALMDGFPHLQCLMAVPGFRIGEVWFACNFRVAPLLNELLAEADTLGYRLGYQVHLRHLAIDPGCVGEARKNSLRMRSLRGIPDGLASMQEQLSKGLEAATAVYEEFLAVDTMMAAEWLNRALRRHFQHQFAPFKFDDPEFEFVEGTYDDPLMAGLHSSTFSKPALEEICASAIDDHACAQLLGWRPSDNLMARLASRLPPPTPNGEADKEDVSIHLPDNLPVPYEGNQPFIFVSYKQQDIASIAPIIHRLIRCGCNVWYDRGIPGGAEWDALIEEKLAQCQMVLLFVSQLAIRSKYVRREVKFADALGKPIISVKLEDAILEHGMNMLLTQYQMIDKMASDFDPQLDKAIQYIRALTAA